MFAFLKAKEIRTRLHNVCRFLKEVEKRGITDLNGITSSLILKLYEEDGYRNWFTISIRAFLKYAFFHSLSVNNLFKIIVDKSMIPQDKEETDFTFDV